MSISDTQVGFSEVTFYIHFAKDVSGRVSGGDSAALKGKQMRELIDFDLNEINERGERRRNSAFQVERIEPEIFDPEKSDYHVHLRVEFSYLSRGSQVQPIAQSKFWKKQDEYRTNTMRWLSKEMAVIVTNVPTNLSIENAYLKLTNAAAQNFPKELISTIVTNITAIRDTNVWTDSMILHKYNSDSEMRSRYKDFNTFLDIYGDPTSDLVLSILGESLPDPRNATPKRLEEAFWVMAYRYAKHLLGDLSPTSFPRDQKTTEPLIKPVNSAPVVSSVSSNRVPNSPYKGFKIIPQKIEQLPPKEAAMNLGQGIANHFIVARVTFVNTNSDDYLLYGEQMTYDCPAKEYSYQSPSAYKILLRSQPDKDLQIDSTTLGANTWRTKHGNTVMGDVRASRTVIQFTPFPMSFMIRGYERREFDTTRSRIFRSLDVAASVAGSVIPFVNTKAYSDYSGVISGVGLPSLKKLFGDATEVQKQTFLQESMPQYLEVKVGQSISKFVYLPLFGADRLRPDKVVFISALGRTQDFNIRVAIIRGVTDQDEVRATSPSSTYEPH